MGQHVRIATTLCPFRIHETERKSINKHKINKHQITKHQITKHQIINDHANRTRFPDGNSSRSMVVRTQNKRCRMMPRRKSPAAVHANDVRVK